MFVSNTPAWEMEKSRLSVTGTLVFNVLAMIVFSAVAATDPDAARSKPLAGLAGLLSAVRRRKKTSKHRLLRQYLYPLLSVPLSPFRRVWLPLPASDSAATSGWSSSRW